TAEEWTAVAENYSEALSYLEQNAHPYANWVWRVLRGIIPLWAAEGLTLSSSNPHHPGVVQLSIGQDPLVLAELLVHEASHQYFHLMEYVGPVDDGSDSTLYYSPFKGTERPLRAILLAYHAFANVLLLYRARRLEAHGDDRAALDLICQRLAEDLAVLDAS